MFEVIARDIAGVIREQREITVEDIENLVMENQGISKREITNQRLINLYPSLHKGPCRTNAIFISLHGTVAKGKGHIQFGSMLNTFYKHMYKSCPDITKHVGFITNDWWTKEFQDHLGYIKEYKNKGVTFEAYFIDYNSKILTINI